MKTKMTVSQKPIAIN